MATLSEQTRFHGAQIRALGQMCVWAPSLAPKHLSRKVRHPCSGRGDVRKKTAYTNPQAARRRRLLRGNAGTKYGSALPGDSAKGSCELRETMLDMVTPAVQIDFRALGKQEG